MKMPNIHGFLSANDEIAIRLYKESKNVCYNLSVVGSGRRRSGDFSDGGFFRGQKILSPLDEKGSERVQKRYKFWTVFWNIFKKKVFAR